MLHELSVEHTALAAPSEPLPLTETFLRTTSLSAGLTVLQRLLHPGANEHSFFADAHSSGSLVTRILTCAFFLTPPKLRAIFDALTTTPQLMPELA